MKTEQRRRVQGVAHGASSSGQTVFIEPLETIEQNNELVRLLDEELAEIHRILVEMTGRIGEQAADLEAAVDVLARAGTAVRQGALRPGLRLCAGEACWPRRGANQAIHLCVNARHPLLERTLKPKGVAGGSAHG